MNYPEQHRRAHLCGEDKGELVGLPSLQTATQAQNQGYELAHPNIHLIYDLPKHVKELVLQTQSCRISTSQGNNRISKRSPSEGPTLIV